VDQYLFVPEKYRTRKYRPAGEPSTWPLRLLAHIAILSLFTSGQGANMGELMCIAAQWRLTDKRARKKSRTSTTSSVSFTTRSWTWRDKGAEELERKCKSALNNKRKKMEAKNKKKAEGETETEDEVIEDAGVSEIEKQGLRRSTR
jgi:hypothetical protein